ncbi:MAG: hypothetical protein WKF97_01165 [Chitinophagaceae bacterium]
MKGTWITILILYLAIPCLAQQDSLQLVKIIKGDIVDFTVDNLGNVYTLSRSNQLKKLNANGDSTGVFNDVRQYGRVASIDAGNPLKLLLFYKDFGTIVVLDRFLNVRNTINLRNRNIFMARAISQSYDNGIWVYDEQEARLKRMNDEGEIIDQSGDFRLFMEAAPSPVQIVDHDRIVYLYDPEKGVFMFDYFGSLRNKVALLGWQDFQVVDGKVFGRKQTIIEQYQPGSLSLKVKALDRYLAGVTRIKISVTQLYCLKDGEIKVYAF